MPPKPNPTRMFRGQVVPNPAYRGDPHDPQPVRPLKFYGNVDHIRFVMSFQDKDRKLKNPQGLRYTRVVEACVKHFGCSDTAARAAVAGLVAYRMAVFTAELPASTAELVEDFRRIAQKAEAEKQYNDAISARREIGKIVGIYAPLLVDVRASSGQRPQASLEDQLRAVMDVLSKEARAGLELALGELEAARIEGRLKLPAGDEEPTPEDPEPPAEAVAVAGAIEAESTETVSAGCG